MRPALPLLVLLAASAANALIGNGCNTTNHPECDRDPRDLEGVTSSSYCLVKFSATCNYRDGSRANSKCPPCYLWTRAKNDCGTGAAGGEPGSNCGAGWVMMKDQNCGAGSTPAASKWMMVLSRDASKGIEEALNGNGGKFDDKFAALWGSSLPRKPNPCTGAHGQYVQTYLDKAPYTAIAMNSVEYRSQHQWHAHIGMAKDDLRGCVNKLMAAGAVTDAGTFSSMQNCSFTSPLSGNAIEAQVWLRLENAGRPTRAVPQNVGTILSQSAQVMKDAGLTRGAILDFTTLAVTGAQLNPGQRMTGQRAKHYFAVLIINYHDAWSKDPSHLRSGSLGDHVLVVSPPKH